MSTIEKHPAPQMRIVETDVLVVGGGGSGLAAAIEAARAGRKVVLLEKNTKTGGSTGWSVGSITATRTPDQFRKGLDDNPQHHFEDMSTLAGHLLPRDNLELRHILVQNVTETLAWLRSLGVEFFGPGEEPPHRMPRMHNVLPTSGSYVYHLTRAALADGVDIHLGTRAKRIVLDGDTLTGIEACDACGQTVFYRAKFGAVLAGGDYSGSAAFKTLYGSKALALVPAVNVTNTGDCQRMVLDIGGEVLNGDLILGPVMRFAAPRRKALIHFIPPWAPLTRAMSWMLHHLPSAMVRPLIMRFMTTVLGPEAKLFEDGVTLVDRTGKCIEPVEGSLGKAIAIAPEQSAWLIFDGQQAERYSAPPHPVSTAPGIAWAYFGDYVRTRPDLHTKAVDLGALAERLGMSPTVLTATLKRIDGEPRQGPFHALGPIHSYVVLTDGGVKVTPQLQVVVHGSTPVRGLYAAGSTGQGGLLLEGHGHHLGWAFTSGRIAGRHAAQLTSTAPSSSKSVT